MGVYDDVINSGSLKGVGEGLVQGWRDAEDRSMKKLEMDSKLKSQEQDRQRQAVMDAMSARKMGFQVGEGPMDYTSVPKLDAAKVKGDQILSAAEKHVQPKFDEQGNVVSASLDPAYAHMMGEPRRLALETRQDGMDRREHNQILSRLSNNHSAQQKLSQFQGLNNSLSIITDSDHLTPEQIHEFQQAIRGNMGMKGQGGVGEREETYFKSLGLSSERMKEFLTGDPATISKDSNLIKHFKQLADIEKRNITKQYDTALNAATGGHTSMYSRRPDLRGDLDDAIAGYKGQMDEPAPTAPPPQAQAPRGLVRQGLMSRMGGMLGLTSDAASANGAHPQDEAAVAWAKNPRSVGWTKEVADAILKANGQ